jgi:heptosyltransferase-2
VILSTPVIKNLRKIFPSSYIAFMCRPYTKEILEGNPYLDEVVVYDKYGKHKSIWSSIKFSFLLRKKKFDWAIILHPTNRVHLITFFAGIPFRVGWDKKLGFLLTKRIPHTKHEGKKHELEYTLDILRELKLPILDKTTYFPIKEEIEKKVNSLLESLGVKIKEKLIVIHPSASCPSKRWPQEYFSSLVKMLKEKFAYKIAVICAKNEEVYGEKVVKDNEVIDLRGKLSISELGALFRRCVLFISNDSGPVHIAWTLKVPVISIFGRRDKGLSSIRWRPLGENSVYLHKNVGCKICLAHNCQKGFLCLKAITPQEVMEKAIYLLNNRRKAP